VCVCVSVSVSVSVCLCACECDSRSENPCLRLGGGLFKSAEHDFEVSVTVVL